ncbi:hypothetical protein EG850_01850 [Gulosibacter macacae]|uniref:Ester cyclase n=1 Tax=Gulosibacter macacae TaxID=2488791 RepID=A0A3P3W6A0_9MICO|nr:ester cyclase [Gulosibacter macacae]RRJ88213.1 hypothetical protein EG850_01850 [Gulosibacter macacae]
MTTNPAEAAALRIQDAINSGDLSGLADCVTADFVDHGARASIPPGPEGYRRALTFVTQVLGITYTLDDLITTPDRIVIRATGHGVGVAEVHGPAAAGREYSMPSIHIYRTEDDRLAEHWAVRDEVAVLQQLGLMPERRPPGARE